MLGLQVGRRDRSGGEPMIDQTRGKVLAPHQRASLHEEIVNRVREMILEGALPPGQWIAEIKLCSDLRVSRTPLREALKVLASESLVKLVQNRGGMGTEVSVDEIVELFEVVEPLEELIGTLAAERMTDGDISAIEVM